MQRERTIESSEGGVRLLSRASFGLPSAMKALPRLAAATG
jgi:hypothetical protein